MTDVACGYCLRIRGTREEVAVAKEPVKIPGSACKCRQAVSFKKISYCLVH